MGRNASSNLGSISENSDFASSRENSFDSDSGVSSAANPVWIKRAYGGDDQASGETLPPPPNYQKAATMPELTLDPSQLSADAYPNLSGAERSQVTDSPFNKKPGAIKKVSFNWHQESEEKADDSSQPSDTYVYDGALSKSTAQGAPAAKSEEAVKPPPPPPPEAEKSSQGVSSEPPTSHEAKERRSDLV